MNFYNPVDIFINKGIRKKIVEEYLQKKILVICSKSSFDRLKKDSFFSKLFKSKHLKFEHSFGNNPSLDDVVNISRRHKDNNFELIIGIGGGSAMDTAKISSVSIPALEVGIDIEQLLSNDSYFDKFNAIELVQVPTTAGTGSEVTPFATVWDYKNNQKKSLSNIKMFAKKAFIDSDLIDEIPFNIACSTGLDALNQAFESIWNKNATSISLMYAREAAIRSLKYLPLLNSETNEEIRSNLAEGSLFAGIAISQTRTSICHSISYPLTLETGIPHGLACAFSMIAVYEFNLSNINNSISIIGEQINGDPLDKIKNIYNELKVHEQIKKYIDKNSAIDLMDKMITAGRFDNNIIPVTNQNLHEIIVNSEKYLYE
jgi:alcohol dehydrogenase